MDLHLHLSVAFRALDRKWGPAIDLDSPDETLSLPCLPAVIDRPSTTFSSEEFLRKRYRPKPYSRFEERRRRNNVKAIESNDSFADISSSRIPLAKFEATSIDSGLDRETSEHISVTKLVEEFERSDNGSTTSLDSVLEEKRPVNILQQFKNSAKLYIQKKCWRKVIC